MGSPVSASINPDENFIEFFRETGRRVYPTHYVLNNVGNFSGEQSGAIGGVRITSPDYYFGYSSNSPSDARPM